MLVFTPAEGLDLHQTLSMWWDCDLKLFNNK